MNNHKIFKKTLAGILSLLTVMAYMPVDNAMIAGLGEKTSITASARGGIISINPDDVSESSPLHSTEDSLTLSIEQNAIYQLTDNIELSHISVDDNINAEIDLNGYNITLNGSMIVGTSKNVTLAITNSHSDESNSKIEITTDEGMVALSEYSTLTIDKGVTVSSKNMMSTIWVKKEAKLNVHGTVKNVSTINNQAYLSSAILVSSTDDMEELMSAMADEGEDFFDGNFNATVNISEGAEVSGHTCAIIQEQCGTINVNGGTVTGDEIAIVITTGTLNASGGLIASKSNDERPTIGAVEVNSNFPVGVQIGGNVQIEGLMQVMLGCDVNMLSGTVDRIVLDDGDNSLHILGGSISGIVDLSTTSSKINIADVATVGARVDSSYTYTEDDVYHYAVKAKNNIVYDGQPLDASDFEIVGLTTEAREFLSQINDSDVGVTFTEGNGVDVGTHTATLHLGEEEVSGVHATIAPAVVTITPKAASMTFGDEIPTIDYTFTGAPEGVETLGDIITVDVDENNDFTEDGRLKVGQYDYCVNLAEATTNYVYDVSDTTQFTVNQKNIADDSIEIILSDKEFEFNNQNHTVTVTSVKDGDYTLVEGVDYVVGGATQKYYPGEYQVQIIGTGNYTGIAKENWSIGEPNAAIVLVEDGKKVYDGNDVTELFTVDTGSIPANKATVTYSYYKAKLDDDNQYQKNGDALSAAPKDAGVYIVEANISAKNFAPMTRTAVLEVQPKPVTVSEITVDVDSYVYGDETPTVTNAIFDGVLEADEIYLDSAEFEWTIDTESMNAGENLKFTGTVTSTEEALNNYDFSALEGTSSVVVEPRNINDESVVFSSDSATLYSGATVTNHVTGTFNGNEMVLGTDFTLSNEKADESGVYYVNIVGKGNFTGETTAEWTVVDTRDIIITDCAKLYNIKENRLALTIDSDLCTEEISPIAKTGVIVIRSKEAPTAEQMTIENAKNDANIRDLSENGTSYTAIIRDTEDSIYYVGYCVLENGIVKYDAVKHTCMTTLKAEKMWVESNSQLYNTNENRLVINVESKGDYPEAVAKTGAFVYRYNNVPLGPPTAMKKADAAQGVYDFSKDGMTDSIIVRDLGYGVAYRPYTLYKDGQMRLGDEIEFTSMVNLEEGYMNTEATAELESLNDKKIKITATTTGEYLNNVVGTGIVVYKGKENPNIVEDSHDEFEEFYSDGTNCTQVIEDTEDGIWYAGVTVFPYGLMKMGEWKHTSTKILATYTTGSSDLYNLKENRLVIKGRTWTDYPEVVKKTGVIVVRDKNQPALEDMTIEGAAANDNIFDFSQDGTTRDVIVKDTQDSVWYRVYTVFDDDSVQYTDMVQTSMSLLKKEAVWVDDYAEAWNIANNRIRITITSKGDTAEEVVAKTGVIVYRGSNSPRPEEMSIESAATNEDIVNLSGDGTEYSAVVRDLYSSVRYVGYTQYKDGTVKYGQIRQTSLSALTSDKV